jgi:hypothetical protein
MTIYALVTIYSVFILRPVSTCSRSSHACLKKHPASVFFFMLVRFTSFLLVGATFSMMVQVILFSLFPFSTVLAEKLLLGIF